MNITFYKYSNYPRYIFILIFPYRAVLIAIRVEIVWSISRLTFSCTRKG